MNSKAFSELLTDWEFRDESDPIRVVSDIIRLTHTFVSTHAEWEKATPTEFHRYTDMVTAAATKRNTNQKLTPDEQRALTAWDDAAVVPLNKQWDTIPEFRKIQFDDGRIRTACQLLSRIQRYENAGQSERQSLLLSIGYLSARLGQLQNRVVESRVEKRAARKATPPTQSETRKTMQRLKPIARVAAEPATSAQDDEIQAVKPAVAAITKRDRDDFAKVLHARDYEANISRSRRIPEDELRAVLAHPAPGKTAILTAASHFGVSTKVIRWRADEYGIDL